VNQNGATSNSPETVKSGSSSSSTHPSNEHHKPPKKDKDKDTDH
jgi:hypothetical protein